MRAVLLLTGLLLISVSCVYADQVSGININNVTDLPAPPEVTTLAQDTTTESNTTDVPTSTSTTEQTTTTKSTTTSTTIPSTTSTTQKPSTTTAQPPKPTDKPSSTETPHTTTGQPPKERHFDGASFLGGIILAVGLMAIGLVVLKFYKARAERNYHTL